MVVGVFCKVGNKKVSFDDCMGCSKCLPAPLIKSLRIFENEAKRNIYYLAEIIGCLRKAYYERKSPRDKHLSLEDLYRKKRGKLFSKIADSTGWQELPGSLSYAIDSESVKLTARLDCYDSDKRVIVELKSLEGVKGRNLPRQKDLFQVQCYGTIFKDVLYEIKGLKIVYLDMKDFRQCNVEYVDRTEWIRERVFSLHRAVRDSVQPPKEESCECRFCDYKQDCIGIGSIVPTVHSSTGRATASGGGSG